MALHCSRRCRRERRCTKAADRHSVRTMYTSSPSPPRSAIFTHAADHSSPSEEKFERKVTTLVEGSEVETPGHHQEAVPGAVSCKAIADRTCVFAYRPPAISLKIN